MSHVDFYILPDENRTSLYHFACSLVEKAYQQGNNVLIKTANSAESQLMDNLLWSFKKDAFLPHTIADSINTEEQPIVISHEMAANSCFKFLINMSSSHAEKNQFEKIAEILNQEPSRKQAGRQHYKIYKDFGFELQHHDIQ